MRLVLAILLVMLTAWGSACAKTLFTGDDIKMMEAAKIVEKAVNAYHIERAEWPETLNEAKPYLPPATEWPVNPYNGLPLADTGSKEFDPKTSVGMVYYERFFRDEQQMNYQLHVFGRKGCIYIIGSTAFGVKK